MRTFWRDLRYALRMLRKSPGFTAVVVLTLALGIGANTAIFSLVYDLMLRTLPVRDPGQLVELSHRYPGEPRLPGFSWQAFQLMRDHNDVFSGLIAASYQSVHIHGDVLELRSAQAGYVDGHFFQVLGIKPALGRLIGPEDDHMGAPSAVGVLSWSLWKNRFDLDPAILGKQIIVEEVPVTVVGVTPRKFLGLQLESSQDLWLPLAMEPANVRSGLGWGALSLVGRLNPRVSIKQASAEMAVLYESTLDEQARATNNPFVRKFTFAMEPAGAGLSRLREEYAKPLLVLMAVVSVLLLIACINVASMLLARGAAREPEMALRISLGASRFRLLRQALTESLLLSMIGSLFGIWLAYFGVGVLVRIIDSTRQPGPPLEFQATIDAGVLLFTGGVAALTAVLFGLVPGLRAWSTVPASQLQAARAGETRFRRLLGKSLAVGQVALSVVLLSAASLLVRNLWNLEHLALGFQRDHVLLVRVDPTLGGYTGEQLSRVYQEILGRLEAIPGVRSASICAVSPIQGPGANHAASVEGYQDKPGEIRNINEDWVAPKYFETLGTPLLAGRDFSLEDQGRSRVAIINQTMARYYFGTGSPIERHVTLDGDDQPYEIIGVVGDTKTYEIREDTLRTIYFNVFQFPRPFSQFVLRTSIAPAAVISGVRSTVRELLKTVSITRVTTLADQVDASIVPERLTANLSGMFGVLSLVLVAVGLYGLLAYTVSRRIREIGIRMALGAQNKAVVSMVIGDGVKLALAGICIGVAGAMALMRFLSSLLYGVAPADPLTFVTVSLLLLGVSLLACYIPARRATRVDPMVALRHE